MFICISDLRTTNLLIIAQLEYARSFGMGKWDSIMGKWDSVNIKIKWITYYFSNTIILSYSIINTVILYIISEKTIIMMNFYIHIIEKGFIIRTKI